MLGPRLIVFTVDPPLHWNGGVGGQPVPFLAHERLDEHQLHGHSHFLCFPTV